jgi:hypothetical protein
MAYRDIERDAITPAAASTISYLSSESSESIESADERVALLDPDLKGSSLPNYKSTSIITTNSEESCSISEPKASKSASAIISLLLVGKVVSSLFLYAPIQRHPLIHNL